MIENILQDIRYALRTFRQRKAFTVLAIVSAGIGIGATTAVYSTVDWLLNRPPGGVVEPGRLVTLHTSDAKSPTPTSLTFTFRQYEEIRKLQDTFTELAAFAKFPGVFTTDQRSDQIVLEFVTGTYFPMLGLRPALGRVVGTADDVAGSPPVVMLSYAFWKSRLGGDPNILEKPITLNGQQCRVIGVAPREFEGYDLDWNGLSDVWLPMQSSYPPLSRDDRLTRTGQNGIFCPLMARLKPGVTLEAARQKAQTWIAQLTIPTGDRYRAAEIAFQPSNEARIGARDVARQFFGILLTVCGLILLAACFNIANFLIGRAVSRRSEIALRTALGATRWRLIRELMIEAGLIGMSAATLGFLIAVQLIHVSAAMPRIFLRLPLTTDAVIDGRMLAVAGVLGILSSVVFGFVPAVLASFRDPIADLKNANPNWSWGKLRLTPRQGLLVFQVALSVTLAVTAGLYGRSLSKIAALDSGYSAPENVLVAHIIPYGLTKERGDLFYQRLMSGLNATPGVVSASIGGNAPYYIGRTFFSTPGHEDVSVESGLTSVAPHLFETMGTRVIAGREFNGSADDMRIGVIVNKVLADKFWPNQNAVGQLINYQKEKRAVTGVVAEDRCGDILAESQPCVYLPFQMGARGSYPRIRTAGNPLTLIPALRKLVHDLEPNIALSEEQSLDADLRDLTAAQRVSAIVTMALAVLAIALLVAGCVSLFASMVRDSIREIAIRMALGASNGRLTRRIVSQGLALTAIGVALGVFAARTVARQLGDQLYKILPTDSLTFVAIPILVLLIGAASVYWSALIATHTDPAKSLRAE